MTKDSKKEKPTKDPKELSRLARRRLAKKLLNRNTRQMTSDRGMPYVTK